jgi:Prealbumin-like fold domain
VICDWYVIPDEQGGAGSPTGSGTVEIHLAACPAGYSGGSYFNDCHGTPIEDVDVTADGPGGYSDTQTSAQVNNPGPGVVVFNDVPAGDVTFHQGIPGDNNSFFIYCSLADADDTVPFTETNDLGFTLNLTDNMSVICDWYTIPDDQGQPEPEPSADNTIEIAKYICPADFAGNMSGFQNACINIMTDVTFTLTNLDSSEESRQKTGSDGKVEFNVPAGDYLVTEDVPGEFSSPVVFCAGAGEDFTRFDPGIDGIPFTETSGEHDTCYWYNVPEDLSGAGEPSSLTIHKSKCPDGYDGNNYFDTCHATGLPGVQFNATGPDGYAKTGTTDDQGHLTFGNLQAGDYTFTETPPTDITVELYAVHCSVEDGDGALLDREYIVPFGAKIEVPAGVSVICDWYNVPEAPGPTGSITIHTFLCSGQEDNDYNWEQDCTNYGDGAGYDLLSAAGEKVANGTTNVDGILLFYSLDDGGWGLKQTTGNWCHAEADRVNADGDVLVANGGNTDVFIYNCGKKSVVTLPSTGAGPISGGVPSGSGNSGLWMLFGGFAGISVLAFVRRRARAA